MRRGRLLGQAALLPWLLLAFLLALSGLAGARETAVTGEEQAARLLERARAAALRLDYTGTIIHYQGPGLQTTRIAHTLEQGGGVERVQWLDGPARDYLRRDTRITWYLPQERRVVHDHVAGMRSFPALSFASARELLRHYQASVLPSERVSGRSAELLQLQPADELRYGYRFWFDTATGLLLRAQRISENGQVVAQTSFSQLAVGRKAVERLRWPRHDTRGWQTERAMHGEADASGWSYRLPDGFRQVASLRRIIGSTQGGTGSPRDVVQLVCSDGLAGVSIFIEPWSASRSAQPLQQGAVNMVGKRVGRFWLTIVGEVPMAATRQIADSLEFTAPALK